MHRLRRRLAALIEPTEPSAPAVGERARSRVAPFELAPGRRAGEVAASAEGRTWFHTFDLVDDAGGTATIQGYDPTPDKTNVFGIPDRLDGQSVLDIGAYDGFFSFEAARRGAADVLATDGECWSGHHTDPHGNFVLIRDATGLEVRDQTIRVEDLSADAVGGRYDLVFFFGVLYHAPDPIGYLRRVRDVTGGHALVETVVDLLDVDRPALAYYPGTYLNGDPSNHFGPNLAAVEGLGLDAGFSRVEHLDTWALHLVQNLRGEPVDPTRVRSARAVFRFWP